MIFIVLPAVFYIAWNFFDVDFTLPSGVVLFFISVVLTLVIEWLFKELRYKMWERERDKERERDYREYSKNLDNLDRKRERRRKSWPFR